MFRLAIGLTSLFVELISITSEGVIAAGLVITGAVLSLGHLAIESFSLQAIVNWVTGCSLPESLPAPADSLALERPVVPSK